MNSAPLQLIADYDLVAGRAVLILKRAMAVHRLFMAAGVLNEVRGI